MSDNENTEIKSEETSGNVSENNQNTETNVTQEENKETIVENQEEDIANLSDEEFSKRFNSNQLISTQVEPEKENKVVTDKEDVSVTGSDKETVIKEQKQDKDIIADVIKEINYEEEYKKLLQPLKANGTTIEIKSTDELVSMAKMGANYTKKMQELKPNMKIIKTLESQGMLSQDKINFAIDLVKGDKNALAQHIKNLGIDLFEINADEPKYSQNNHIISDDQYDTETRLTEVYQNPAGKEVLDSIVNWDSETQQIVLKDPMILNSLVNQAETGDFKAITQEIERQKSLGKLNNIPMNIAYANIAKQLNRVPQQNTIKNNNSVDNILDIKVGNAVEKQLTNNDKVNSLNSLKSKKSTNTVSLDQLADLDDDAFTIAFNKLHKR